MESLRYIYITDTLMQGRELGKDKLELRVGKVNLQDCEKEFLREKGEYSRNV